MKISNTLVVMAVCASLASCFKDEAPNAECDIYQAYIHADKPEEVFFKASDSLVNVLTGENRIKFNARRIPDITRVAPVFRITEGAAMQPENGSVQDFSAGPVVYTVTSQDRQWHRTYTVSIDEQTKYISDIRLLGFENFSLDADNGKYYVWKETAPDGKEIDVWATGNPGFNLSNGNAKPDQYPTVPIDGGVEGKAVKLTTSDTGLMGAMVNMRLAAGNLFTGKFDVKNALIDAMQATMFGVPVARKPVRFEGYYKYAPGAKYQDRSGKPVPGKTDKGDIYAVLYKNTDASGNAVVLHGDDVRTNPNIVALAVMDELPPADAWTKFDMPFAFSEDIDPLRLANYGYNIALVFTSSKDGATFQGAIGSTLMVDQVKITWEQSTADR